MAIVLGFFFWFFLFVFCMAWIVMSHGARVDRVRQEQQAQQVQKEHWDAFYKEHPDWFDEWHAEHPEANH